MMFMIGMKRKFEEFWINIEGREITARNLELRGKQLRFLNRGAKTTLFESRGKQLRISLLFYSEIS